MIIQFVCRANVFRSIVAEAYLNSLQLPGVSVSSSGTVANKIKDENAENFQKTLGLLKKHGIAQYAKGHHGDNIDQAELDKADVVVFLDRKAYNEAIGAYVLPQKTYVCDVIDVGEEGRIAASSTERRNFAEDVYQEIIKNVDTLITEYGFKANGPALV